MGHTHYPKRSMRKTACNIILVWEGMKAPPVKTSFIPEDEYQRQLELWRCTKDFYLPKAPENVYISLRFNQVSCTKCRRSSFFLQDMIQWELCEMTTDEWDKQFQRPYTGFPR